MPVVEVAYRVALRGRGTLARWAAQAVSCQQVLPSASSLFIVLQSFATLPEKAPLNTSKRNIREAGKNLGDKAGPVLEALTGASVEEPFFEKPQTVSGRRRNTRETKQQAPEIKQRR